MTDSAIEYIQANCTHPHSISTNRLQFTLAAFDFVNVKLTMSTELKFKTEDRICSSHL